MQSLSRQVTHSSLRTGDKAMRAVFRWAITDHTGLGDTFDRTPIGVQFS